VEHVDENHKWPSHIDSIFVQALPYIQEPLCIMKAVIVLTSLNLPGKLICKLSTVQESQVPLPPASTASVLTHTQFSDKNFLHEMMFKKQLFACEMCQMQKVIHREKKVARTETQVKQHRHIPLMKRLPGSSNS